MVAAGSAADELTALERGLHALNSGMDGKAYAVSVGRSQPTIAREISAARVAGAVTDIGYEVGDRFSQLVEIHAAPDWLWPALVAAMLRDGIKTAAPATAHRSGDLGSLARRMPPGRALGRGQGILSAAAG